MGRLAAVTGATGFIGRHTLAALRRRGWEVRVLTRRHPADLLSPYHRLELVLGDVHDEGALERLVDGAQAIIHLAGLVKALTPEDFYAVNETGTERLLRAANRRNPGAALVHVSSLAAREPQLSPYCDSKRRGEAQVEALAAGRPWTIVRPPAVYGPGDLELLPMFKAARLGLVPYPAIPGATLSMIHGADLGEAIAATLDRQGDRQALFEVDDGTPGGYRWPDLLGALGGAVGTKPKGVRVPRWALAATAWGNARLADLDRRARVLFPHKVAEIYFPDWVARGERLSAVADWQPKFDIWTGFKDTVRAYREAHLLS
jgi:nucleoside-diphosphate-sugar epimerase